MEPPTRQQCICIIIINVFYLIFFSIQFRETAKNSPDEEIENGIYVTNTGPGEYNGLKFSKSVTTEELLAVDGTPIDTDEFCKGRRLVHVILANNHYNRPHNAGNIKEHEFELGLDKGCKLDKGGIFANGLLPVCTKDHLCDKAIAVVWASPIGCLLAYIYHIWKNHRAGFIASKYEVAICLIAKEDLRFFTQFNTGSV